MKDHRRKKEGKKKEKKSTSERAWACLSHMKDKKTGVDPHGPSLSARTGGKKAEVQLATGSDKQRHSIIVLIGCFRDLQRFADVRRTWPPKSGAMCVKR